jgi:hypothetical protein
MGNKRFPLTVNFVSAIRDADLNALDRMLRFNADQVDFLGFRDVRGNTLFHLVVQKWLQFPPCQTNYTLPLNDPFHQFYPNMEGCDLEILVKMFLELGIAPTIENTAGETVVSLIRAANWPINERFEALFKTPFKPLQVPPPVTATATRPQPWLKLDYLQDWVSSGLAFVKSPFSSWKGISACQKKHASKEFLNNTWLNDYHKQNPNVLAAFQMREEIRGNATAAKGIYFPSDHKQFRHNPCLTQANSPVTSGELVGELPTIIAVGTVFFSAWNFFFSHKKPKKSTENLTRKEYSH